MLDRHIAPLTKPLLSPLVKLLYSKKISPNQVTVASFWLGLIALPLLLFQYWYLALFFILINRIGDGIDGELARCANHSTSTGGFLDISLDFIFYASIPLGFILADPLQNAVAGGILIFSFIGTGSSFLAFAIAAEKLGIEKIQFKTKSFYYLHGITEGFETIVIFIAFCLFPNYFPYLAGLFSILCIITIITRIYGGYHTLKAAESHHTAH